MTSSRMKGISNFQREVVKIENPENRIQKIGVFHKPDWVLGVHSWSKWGKNRYYSELFYKGEFIKVYREVGADTWYEKESNEVFPLNDNEKELLKSIEESST